MTPSFIYQRKDGGTTHCYGMIAEDSNFSIVCDDEYNDGIWTDNESFSTWAQVCKFLENNYDNNIEELSTI